MTVFKLEYAGFGTEWNRPQDDVEAPQSMNGIVLSHLLHFQYSLSRLGRAKSTLEDAWATGLGTWIRPWLSLLVSLQIHTSALKPSILWMCEGTPETFRRRQDETRRRTETEERSTPQRQKFKYIHLPNCSPCNFKIYAMHAELATRTAGKVALWDVSANRKGIYVCAALPLSPVQSASVWLNWNRVIRQLMEYWTGLGSQRVVLLSLLASLHVLPYVSKRGRSEEPCEAAKKFSKAEAWKFGVNGKYNVFKN